MRSMEPFDDVSVVASVDESPPPPRVPRRVRTAFAVVVASVVVAGALAGAAVGLADEKAEPSRSAAPASESFKGYGGHECKGKRHMRSSSSSGLNY
jgi:hypothetical protein